MTNINLDLIFAIPGQTLAQLDADLTAALALEPEHLSCYGLTYEPHTPLAVQRARGLVRPIDEDLERQMYQEVIDRLAAAGFEHYEISNWARRNPKSQVSDLKSQISDRPSPGLSPRNPGVSALTCRHNLSYWHNRNWLGVGPAAASHVAGHRWKNQPHLARYLASDAEPPIADQEFLPPPRRVGEALMLRLRLREGVPLTWLSTHLPPPDPRHGAIAELESIGMLHRTATHLRLTDRGLFVADAVIARLL
jgi:oxygen-independent coproporphyrinogen-3 oxidase